MSDKVTETNKFPKPSEWIEIKKKLRKEAEEEQKRLHDSWKGMGASDITPADRARDLELNRILATKFVEIDGKEVECSVVNPEREFARLRAQGKEIVRFRKNINVDAWQAKGGEEFINVQDGSHYKAEAGDWIIQNSKEESPYIYGDGDLENRLRQFSENYEPIEGNTGKYRKKSEIQAIYVDRPIVFRAAWGDEMAVGLGGVLTDRGYSIARSSLEKYYEKIEQPKRE